MTGPLRVNRLADLIGLKLRVWQPSAALRERLSQRGPVLVAGHEVPYAAFIACSFDPADPTICSQLGVGGAS